MIVVVLYYYYLIYGIESQGSTQKAATACSKVLSYTQRNPNMKRDEFDRNSPMSLASGCQDTWQVPRSFKPHNMGNCC